MWGASGSKWGLEVPDYHPSPRGCEDSREHAKDAIQLWKIDKYHVQMQFCLQSLENDDV
jgi:hypothetical protein